MENRVVCIKPYKSILTVNKVYEVEREDDDTVIIVGNGSIRYVIPRAYFMEVKVIKKMRYTKESCAYIPNMKIGEVYEVVEETKYGFYIVINSKRMTARVPKNCFEDIERVVCVDNATNRYITVGKEYDVVEDKELILIKNDTGNVEMYPRRLFKSKEDKSINISFDTTELQAKLEKALYHLNELNKVMDEIGDGDIKVKVNR